MRRASGVLDFQDRGSAVSLSCASGVLDFMIEAPLPVQAASPPRCLHRGRSQRQHPRVVHLHT